MRVKYVECIFGVSIDIYDFVLSVRSHVRAINFLFWEDVLSGSELASMT